jgi:hypothetical protein
MMETVDYSAVMWERTTEKWENSVGLSVNILET